MTHEWRLRAYCLIHKVNPEVFEDPAHEETALAICQRCSVHVECLAYALSLKPHPEGVWGRTTYDERRGVKRGGHRASCPGCTGTNVFSDGVGEICVSCGLSWLT